MKRCPKCGRQPRRVQVGYRRRGAWDGHDLIYYVLRCRPFWGLLGTHLTTEHKGVSTGDAWYRWEQDLVDEWDRLAKGLAWALEGEQ